MNGVPVLTARLLKELLMTKLLFSQNPFLLGFDRVEEMMIKLTKQAGESSYPPYNIEHDSQTDTIKIVIAVAGFGVNDLEIQLQDNQLTVRGKQQEEREKNYLYRGIAARQFQRSFILASGVEITEAVLEKGLLIIGLRRLLPDLTTKNVPIRQVGK